MRYFIVVLAVIVVAASSSFVDAKSKKATTKFEGDFEFVDEVSQLNNKINIY